MNDQKNRIDQAFGNTPEGFSRRMQSTLAQCQPVRRAAQRKPMRVLAFAAALVLLCGTAAAVLASHGMLWWMDNRWQYIQQYNPDLYAQIRRSLQQDIQQLDLDGDGMLTVTVQDAAWLQDQAFIAIQAVCDQGKYEMHPYYNFDVDGGLSDNPLANEESDHYLHWLWTEKGFGLPKDVMLDSTKQLLVFYGDQVFVGSPDGPELLGAYDVLRADDGNTVLFALEYDRKSFESKEVITAIEQYTDKDGYLTLCYPYEARLFANDTFGPAITQGCVNFKIKVQ